MLRRRIPCFRDRNLFLWHKPFSATETFFCDRKLLLWHRLVSLTKQKFFLYFCDRNIFFGFLPVNFSEKFLWEMGVSVISDNGDDNFVEPCQSVSFLFGQCWAVDSPANSASSCHRKFIGETSILKNWHKKVCVLKDFVTPDLKFTLVSSEMPT